jgi:hypothetical protein
MLSRSTTASSDKFESQIQKQGEGTIDGKLEKQIKGESEGEIDGKLESHDSKYEDDIDNIIGNHRSGDEDAEEKEELEM